MLAQLECRVLVITEHSEREVRKVVDRVAHQPPAVSFPESLEPESSQQPVEIRLVKILRSKKTVADRLSCDSEKTKNSY